MKKIHFILFTSLLIFFQKALHGQADSNFSFVAHRGASYLAPENTLASILLAWELGADAAECDVMLTSDHQVILCHDKNTKNLTGESYVVSETPWQQLSLLQIKARESHLPEYKNEKISLLKDVLATIPEDRMLVIEIKTGPEILPYLQECIATHWKRGNISFIAFDFETIVAAKSLYPELSCYYLSSFKKDVKKHFDQALEKELDGMNLHYRLIRPSLVKKCKSAGLDVWCWTVNDPEIAWKMKDMGVSAVTTDRPAWLKRQMKAEPAD
jgi:glycerophosphoryl diester phosphodiesterase